jgi:hypothetical protein
VRADDVRLERGEVELDHAIVMALGMCFDLAIGLEQRAAAQCGARDLRAAGRLQIARHPLVGGEDRGRGAELGAHVGDRRLAGRADRARAGTDVLDDRVRGARDRELACDPQDHVLRRRPSAEPPGEDHRDAPRIARLPRQPRDRLHCIRAADADRARAEAARVGSVRVGAEDQRAREGVVLEHDLVDDPGARLPEADAESRRGRAQEVVDLAVLGERGAQVGGAVDARLDQVVAVDRGRHRDALAAGLHELEHAGLAQHVLEHDAVGAQRELAVPDVELLALGIVEVAEQDLLGQGERAGQAPPHHFEVARHRGVQGVGHVREIAASSLIRKMNLFSGLMQIIRQ